MQTPRIGVRSEPSRQVLAELPVRVVVFLRGVAAHVEIRAALRAGGYTAREHEEGLALLNGVCAFGEEPNAVSDDRAARDASSAAAEWLGARLPRLRAAFERLHPERTALFERLDTSRNSAVLALATLLQRIDALERAAHDARGACNAHDANARGAEDAALTTLERRGLTPVERARLNAIVAVAQTAVTPLRGEREHERSVTLLALHRWFQDWSATARVFVERRDHLVLLGLAGRRK